MKYLIVIEPTSTGATKSETERNMAEAIEFHLEGLREEGLEAPESDMSSAYIETEAS